MKKIILVISSLFFLLACRNGILILKYMKMTPPSGWKIENDRIDPNTVTFKKVINKTECLITIGSHKQSKTKTWSEIKSILTGERGNITIKEKKEEIGENEWMTLERKTVYNHGITIHSLYLFANKNGETYNSIFVANDKVYDMVFPEFIQLINSVKFINK